MKLARSPWTWLLLLLFCLACNAFGKKEVEAQPGRSGGPAAREELPLQLRLSEGKPIDNQVEERATASGTPLSQARVDEILKMFKEPLEEEKDPPEFFKRPASKPAPRSATPKEMPFPAPGDSAPPEVKAGKPAVLSISPEGDMERAPRLSISFATPMTAVSDPTDAEQGNPLGIAIKPRPDGKWRWLGTQTLIFEPTGSEFPRATEYTVTVPASAADVNGVALGQEVSQSFKLPRPKVESFAPSGGGHSLDPLLTIVFDQPVVPEVALKLMHLRQGSKELGWRRLTPSEAEKFSPGLAKSHEGYLPNRVFHFKANEKLSPGTTYTLVVDKGVQSAEGPLLGEAEQTSSFSTYAPLTLTGQYPSAGQEISPFYDFYLHFNNNLDPAKFRPDMVSIKPAVENLKVRVAGGSLYLSGTKSGNTTYTVTVDARLADTFGQTLGKPVIVELKTGRAPKVLSHGYESFTVLDPSVAPGLPIFTTNIDSLDLEVYQVQPQDWGNYLTYLYDHQRAYTPEDRKKLRLPGKRLAQKKVKLEAKPDQLVTTGLDLSEYLDKGEGNLVVWVKDPAEDKEKYRSREFVTWVQGTKLGIDLEIGPQKVAAMVTTLRDGKPVSGAALSLGKEKATTDAQGAATLALPDTSARLLLAESQGSSAFVPYAVNGYSKDSGWLAHAPSEQQQWFLFDDRGLYKPGEKAVVKGYIRAWQRGPEGQLALRGTTGDTVNWVLNDPRGNKLKEGTTKLNAFSAVELEVELPKDTNLGSHQLTLSAPGLTSGYHSLNVQEFRRPEFEVKSSILTSQPYLLQGSATAEVVASYYAGGALTNSTVQWTASTSPAGYTPPGRGDYTFGRWTPWWDMGHWWIDGNESGSSSVSFEGKTDSEGKHLLNVDFLDMHPPRPTTVTLTASVADVNRQQQSSTASLLVHPSERYVGVQAKKSFVDEKSDFPLELIVTDIDGRLLPGIPVDVELFQVDYEYSSRGGYQRKDKLVEKKSVTSAETPTEVILKPREGGTYRVVTYVRDQKERVNQTELTFWKAGGSLPSTDKVELETLTVVPDRKEYEPGQTAEILVMAPFAEGEGMVVWSRDGFMRQERFSLKNGTATLRQPLTEEMIPNVRASITCVGKAAWGKRERPAVAVANLDLSISTASRKLTIELEPDRDSLEPGGEVNIPVLVKDSQGKPVSGSEVTLWMVDEAVLGLTGYTTPNPLPPYYAHRPNVMTPHHNRIFIKLADPQMEAPPEEPVSEMSAQAIPAPSALAKSAPARMRSARDEAPMEDAGLLGESAEMKKAQDSPATEFAVRKNFDALAVFEGDLATDAAGRTSVKVKLPDNLTRYRIMSVAVKGADKYGSGDHLVTARLPLMVRPSLPRFLNFGDKAKLPVVIQNQTDRALKVEVVGQANGVTWIGTAGQSVSVPANDRIEVMFQAEATAVGPAHFRFGVVSGAYSDAATLSLPVYTPASGEAFATYGSVADNGAVKQVVKRPGDVWTQFGGLDISLSSTALSELTDAFLYLFEYPFECSEQKASRILGIATMREVLSAMNPSMMPASSEIESQMKSDLLHLARLQNSDGGYDYWRRDEESIPFLSVHVMHALARSKAEGYAVSADTLSRGLNYLKSIEAKCQALGYTEYTTRTITAYALYVRNLLKDPDVAKAKALFPYFSDQKSPDLESLGWIWPTLADHAKDSKELVELRRLVKNRATETADKAQFSASYGEAQGEYLLLYSSRRTDAILLAGLLNDQPADPLNAKLVRGLLAHRTKGRWSNTQENIWILLALQAYFRAYEKDTPNFLASLWLDGTYLGEEKFEGRSGKEAQVHVPMDKISEKNSDLILAKEGPGRLYYRIGMQYAPKNLRLPAENRGFLVERTYRGIDDESDVTKLENGDWQIKAGAKVEVTLTMVAPERRYHVALVDQLPAGLEPLNPALKGTPPTSHGGTVKRTRGWYGWWWRWYEHENLRDERVEAFTSLLYPGVYTYSYTALATTPGEYVLPPLKAEEMYSPEVFGRTATGRLVVK